MHIISSLILMISLSVIVIKEFCIIQSFHYEIKKYYAYIFKNKKYYYFLYCLLLLFVIKFDLLFGFLATLLLLFTIKKYNLQFTNRIKRLLGINIVLLIVFSIFNLLKYIYVFSFFYLFFLHCVSLFIEEIIFSRYLKSARRKVNDKFVIGITGSGGKTSLKNMIYDVLISEFNVSKTPGSYNNKRGIVRGINEEVKKQDEFFVCEYGVDKKEEMNRLIRIVKPNLSVITYIGNQHLLTFKSVDNIFKEKIKLIDKLDDGGIGVINNDDKLLREYDYKNKHIIRYGIDYDSDVMGKNIEIKIDHSEFDLYIKDTFIKRCEISLLSRNGVENTLAVVAILLGLNFSVDYIVKHIEKVRPIAHRLEYKIIDSIEVIDDSFNSNIKGFINAIELLTKSNKYKIVITPGIIEQGKNNIMVNKEVAKELMKCDFVCLVTDNTKVIKDEFMESQFDKYEEFDSFVSAFEYIKKIEKDKIVLIENDLPDIYLK